MTMTADRQDLVAKLRQDEAHHVLVVIKDARARQAVIRQLGEAGLLVTVATSFGLVDALEAGEQDFDLLVTAQSTAEMAHFGLPQLARSVDPELPILVLDSEAVRGAGLLAAVHDAIGRWPLRELPIRRVH